MKLSKLCEAVNLLFLCLIIIRSCRCLEGQNVCKKSKSATDGEDKTSEFFCCAGFKEKNNKCVECKECINRFCPPGFCGQNCLKRCDHCPGSSFCHPEHCCFCSAGFTGPNCDKRCSAGYYGENCTNGCVCSEHGTCNIETGICNCDSGWTGSTCDNKWSNSASTNDHLCDPNLDKRRCQADNVSFPNTERPGTTDSGDFIGRTYVHSYMIIFIVVMGLLCILLAAIFCIKFLIVKKRQNQQDRHDNRIYSHGHYDEINPQDEISPEELAQLRLPYYSSPAEIHNIKTHPIPSVHLSEINKSTSHDLTTKEKQSVLKYLSLPNLTIKDIHLISLPQRSQSVNERYVHLLKTKLSDTIIENECRQPNNVNGTEYLHPYSSLIHSNVNNSGYLYPYSSLIQDVKGSGYNKTQKNPEHRS